MFESVILDVICGVPTDTLVSHESRQNPYSLNRIVGVISQYVENELECEEWVLTTIPDNRMKKFHDIHSMTTVEMKIPLTVLQGPRMSVDLTTCLGLPTRWKLSIRLNEITRWSEETRTIPSDIASYLLNLWNQYDYDKNKVIQCNDFVCRIVRARDGPLLVHTDDKSQMLPWDPIALFSKTISTAQTVASITLPHGFLHAALWTGISDYYLSKIGIDNNYIICRLSEMRRMYPTYSKTLYSRPYRAYCGNMSCPFYTKPPPTTIYCPCRQIQYCSKECRRSIWESHQTVCRFTRSSFRASRPFWIMSKEEVLYHIQKIQSFDPVAYARVATVSLSDFKS